jgi:hypothetical protein
MSIAMSTISFFKVFLFRRIFTNFRTFHRFSTDHWKQPFAIICWLQTINVEAVAVAATIKQTVVKRWKRQVLLAVELLVLFSRN